MFQQQFKWVLISLGLLFLIQSPAMADAERAVLQPEPIVGAYVFVDRLRPVIKLDVRRVFGFTQVGRDKLKALKNKGYRCQAFPRQTFRCIQRQALEEVVDSVERRAFEKVRENMWFDFLDVRATVEEVVNNESYKMWRVFQPVSTAHGTYESYEWSWTPEVSKITLRGTEKDHLPTLYLNLGELNELNTQISVSQTLTRDHFQIHIVQAIFEKGCFLGGFIRSSHGCRDSYPVR